MSEKNARKIGLRSTGETLSFKGVGQATAEKAEPAEFTLPYGKSMFITIYIFKSLIPTILGLKTLKEMKITIDPAKFTWSPKQEAVAYVTSPVSKNLVSGVVDGLSDEDLLKEREEELKQAIGNEMPKGFREKFFNLFRNRPKSWVRPRTGQCLVGGEVKIEVPGPQ
eukprot:GHVP01025655.1.p2 GENE.GHVP01025655.1~~GHVP01025655.1.p2  ORF type:complete len:167 (-),score=17.92 GHVP01025655.1:3770-4270(-)